MSISPFAAAFAQVIDEFQQLAPKYQAVIKDITMKMGKGMADFAHRRTVETVADYNLVGLFFLFPPPPPPAADHSL